MNTTQPDTPHATRRLPFRISLVAVVLPLVLAAIGVGLQLAWLSDLPATIAMHWSLAGEPDGFGPAWSMPVVLGVVGFGIPAVFGLILSRSVAAAGPTVAQKLLATTSLAVVSYVATLFTFTVAAQRESTATAVPILPALGIGLAVAIALGIAGWFAMPRAVSGASTPGTEVPPLQLAPGEHAVWVGHARFSSTVLVALGTTVALLTGLMAFVIAISGVWPVAIVPVAVAALVFGMSSWRVRIDETGLTARSALGVPRYHVPLAEVESAAAVEVVPLGEFGGYGVRWGLGKRLGIVTRGGAGLEVQRRDGRAIVVTVDDAATAAGLLAALIARR